MPSFQGVQAGLNQAFQNNIHKYEPIPVDDGDDQEEEEEEEEVMTRSANSNLKSAYPKLTQVT